MFAARKRNGGMFSKAATQHRMALRAHGSTDRCHRQSEYCLQRATDPNKAQPITQGLAC